MELPIIIYTLVGFSLILIIGIIVSVLRESPSHLESNVNNTDDVTSNAQEKSNTIIHRAIQQAREVLIKAELSGIKEIVRSKHDTGKLELVFEEHLKKLIEESSEHLEKTSYQIENHYISLFQNTEAFVNKQIQDNQQRILNQLDLVTKESEKTISTASEAARLELIRRMDAELNASKKLIQDYQRKRMEVIDREIVEIVAQTVKHTLGKTLSKEDHADLIYQSLERAKQDGFFG